MSTVWRIKCRWSDNGDYGTEIYDVFFNLGVVFCGSSYDKKTGEEIRTSKDNFNGVKEGDYCSITAGATAVGIGRIKTNPASLRELGFSEKDKELFSSGIYKEFNFDDMELDLDSIWGCRAELFDIGDNTITYGNAQTRLIISEDFKRGNEIIELYKKMEHNMKDELLKEMVIAAKNIVLTGAPGTGKTYLAKNIAARIMFDKQFTDLTKEERDQIGYVQFHPSYDYTDFVEGLRPIPGEGNAIGFDRKDGVFKEFCKDAIDGSQHKKVFIIDEINRGEVSKIFGELFNAIETGYRGESGQIKTQYQNLVKQNDVFNHGFYVPNNVFIIGTMNDIDRSVESIDFAFRRRFSWIEITAAETQEAILANLKKEEWKETAKKRMNSLNDAIWNGNGGIEGLSSSYHIGAAYFLKLNDLDGDFNKLWEFHLAPLLREYLRGMDCSEEKFKKLQDAYYE